MFARRCVLGLSLLCLALSIAGCAASGLDSIQVTPTTQALTVGQTAQFIAAGTYGNANHPTTQNITSGVTWTSSVPSVATVSASGIATAVGAGWARAAAGAAAGGAEPGRGGTAGAARCRLRKGSGFCG